MSQRANVRSVDSIDTFRSNLVVYLSQARPALEEISAEVLRTRSWLENEQRIHWEHVLARRRKLLEESQQALFSARLGMLRKESAVEQLVFQRAKRAVEEAEDKLRLLKKWTREFDSRVQPLVKQIEKLQTVFSNDMVQALAYLAQTVQSLSAYTEMQAPAADVPSVASGVPTSKPEASG